MAMTMPMTMTMLMMVSKLNKTSKVTFDSFNIERLLSSSSSSPSSSSSSSSPSPSSSWKNLQRDVSPVSQLEHRVSGPSRRFFCWAHYHYHEDDDDYDDRDDDDDGQDDLDDDVTILGFVGLIPLLFPPPLRLRPRHWEMRIMISLINAHYHKSSYPSWIYFLVLNFPVALFLAPLLLFVSFFHTSNHQ